MSEPERSRGAGLLLPLAGARAPTQTLPRKNRPCGFIEVFEGLPRRFALWRRRCAGRLDAGWFSFWCGLVVGLLWFRCGLVVRSLWVPCPVAGLLRRAGRLLHWAR